LVKPQRSWDVVIIGAGPAGAAAARACVLGGLKTAVIEKHKLPRHKACSGIIIPASAQILHDQFGAIPPKVRANPDILKAMRMHFKSGRTFDVPLDGLSVHRELFDEWLIHATGADLFEETAFLSFTEQTDRVELVCQQERTREISLACQVLIAADGGASGTVREIDPVRWERLPWYVALQEIYDRHVELETGYFHFFARPEISVYLSAYVKDGMLVMEVVARKGESARMNMARFKDFLLGPQAASGFQPVRRLGCQIAYAGALGSFCFGSGRVLIAGEASGLLNLFGEGISSALASGNMAGMTAVEGIRQGVAPGGIYRERLEAVSSRTIAQYRMAEILSGRVPTFRWREGLQELPCRERAGLIKDLLGWFVTLKRAGRSPMRSH
jgi:flavin-dependent dehydrogenase